MPNKRSQSVDRKYLSNKQETVYGTERSMCVRVCACVCTVVHIYIYTDINACTQRHSGLTCLHTYTDAYIKICIYASLFGFSN